MGYKLIKSYTATGTVAPKSVFSIDGNVLGIVDDVDTVDAYEEGDEVPVVVDGIAKLSATVYYNNAGTWTATQGKEGEVLFYDSGKVKIDDGTAKSYQIIGKITRVLGDNLYEVKIGL